MAMNRPEEDSDLIETVFEEPIPSKPYCGVCHDHFKQGHDGSGYYQHIQSVRHRAN